jgi:hypothetical protein
MADWQRAPRELACGAERGCTIPAGAWYCLVTAARKVRCTRHSGLQPPAEDVPRPVPALSGFTALRQVAQALDPKMRQAGERDE